MADVTVRVSQSVLRPASGSEAVFVGYFDDQVYDDPIADAPVAEPPTQVALVAAVHDLGAGRNRETAFFRNEVDRRSEDLLRGAAEAAFAEDPARELLVVGTTLALNLTLAVLREPLVDTTRLMLSSQARPLDEAEKQTEMPGAPTRDPRTGRRRDERGRFI